MSPEDFYISTLNTHRGGVCILIVVVEFPEENLLENPGII